MKGIIIFDPLGELLKMEKEIKKALESIAESSENTTLNYNGEQIERGYSDGL